MRSTTQTQPLCKQDATQAVTEIVKGVPSNFELVPFTDFKAHTKLRSGRYNSFDVLCYKNTRKSSGWLICPYVKTKGCTLASGVMSFNVSKGGTEKFERHAQNHEKKSEERRTLPRALPALSKTNISRAAAHAVVLDLRPISFTENKKGMRMFVSSIFEAGQNTPKSDQIDPKSYLPSSTCVANSLKELAHENREEYKTMLLEKMYEHGGALTTDEVTLSVQDKHFYDLTLHSIDVSGSTSFGGELRVVMRVVTLLLKEKPEVCDGIGLRSMLGGYLQSVYGRDSDWLTKRFTMVTDCAAVMARVALSSVSSRVARMDEKWMGCFAHQINTAMKSCLSSLSENDDLEEVYSNVQTVKKIVKIFKQGNWNTLLPSGFHLIQECETRFSTTFTVVQRFIKSATKVKEIIDQKGSTPAREAFAALHIEGNSTVSSLRFPALQAIIDALGILVETQTRVQAGNTPTIHLALPLFHRCLDELDRISDGGSVWHENEGGLVPPSRVCRKLCRSLIGWLEAKVRVHDLWLVGCYLHPLLREFQFVSAVHKRQEYRGRAEDMARALIASFSSASVDENTDVTANELSVESLLGEIQSRDARCEGTTVSGRKRVFSMLEFADSHFQPTVPVDEVSRYNAMDISVLGLDRKAFMRDEFSTIKFWHQRKSTYPSLYKVSCRVYATPVISCASEQLFSALKRVVSHDRASLGPQTIVLRSMLS